MANRTTFGRQVLAGQWAAAEFEVLGMMWQAGAPVPYPVELDGTEILLEFIGDPDGTAAPRLAQVRGTSDELHDHVGSVRRRDVPARHGGTRPRRPLGVQPACPQWTVGGDRRPAGDRPSSRTRAATSSCGRDAENVCRLFSSHGVAADAADLTVRLLDEARMLRPGGGAAMVL